MSGKGKGVLQKEVPPHGTRERFIHRVFPCKCDECRRAQAEYIKLYRQNRRSRTGEKLIKGRFVK